MAVVLAAGKSWVLSRASLFTYIQAPSPFRVAPKGFFFPATPDRRPAPRSFSPTRPLYRESLGPIPAVHRPHARSSLVRPVMMGVHDFSNNRSCVNGLMSAKRRRSLIFAGAFMFFLLLIHASSSSGSSASRLREYGYQKIQVFKQAPAVVTPRLTLDDVSDKLPPSHDSVRLPPPPPSPPRQISSLIRGRFVCLFRSDCLTISWPSCSRGDFVCIAVCRGRLAGTHNPRYIYFLQAQRD